jgi:hypothetical protein
MKQVIKNHTNSVNAPWPDMVPKRAYQVSGRADNRQPPRKTKRRRAQRPANKNEMATMKPLKEQR